MALKITEVDGKLILEGNINSVTSQLLKQHMKIMKNPSAYRRRRAINKKNSSENNNYLELVI